MANKYLYGAAAALLLTACSQDEVVSMKQDGINYSVFAKNQTRAANSYCNINLPGSFNVWAQIADEEGKLYIEGDQINKTDANTWVDASGTRYWPQGKSLNFFAHVNGGTNYKYNNGAPTFDNFAVNSDVTRQLDLMYSVNKGAQNNGSPVTLNFRHALSQVCFKASNKTNNLDITISSVSVGHLQGQGTYTYPAVSTDQNIVDPGHDDVDNNLNWQGSSRGSWTLDGANTNVYKAPVNNGLVTIAANAGTANLTCPGDNHGNGFTNVLTLLPQTVAAWNPEIKGADYNGAYFLLDVVLMDKDAAEGAKVVYSGQIAMPVNIAWQEGCRYIYTFIFNEGTNGGYTPDPSDPKPILTSIEYNVTVDDFIPVNGDGNGTNMGTGDHNYASTGIITLNYNYQGAPANKISQIKTDNATYSFTFGSEYSPSAREGYTFLGWAASADATEAVFEEGSAATLSMTEGNANDFTFYAVWSLKDVTNSVVVKFDDGMGNTTSLSVTTINGKGEVTCPEAPSRKYFTFGGWEWNGKTYKPGEKVEFEESNIPSFTAKWTENSFYTMTLKSPYAATVDGNALPLTFKVYVDDDYKFTFPAPVKGEGNNGTFKNWALMDGDVPTTITKATGAEYTLTGDVVFSAGWDFDSSFEGDGSGSTKED